MANKKEDLLTNVEVVGSVFFCVMWVGILFGFVCVLTSPIKFLKIGEVYLQNPGKWFAILGYIFVLIGLVGWGISTMIYDSSKLKQE
ncbi:MAG: hypothetical protein V1804_01845 [Patescibacteria group bacterium]